VRTYRAGGGLLLGALAIDLEGNTVGGGALDLKGSSRNVVEVLVQQLKPNIISLHPPHARIPTLFQGWQSGLLGPLSPFVISYIVGQLRNIGECWDRHLDGDVWVYGRTGGKYKKVVGDTEV
jgi:hypothetical protein